MNESRLFRVPLKTKSRQLVDVRWVCERGKIDPTDGKRTANRENYFLRIQPQHILWIFTSAVLETHPATGMEGPIVRGLHCITLQRLFAQRLLSDLPDRRTASLCHTWSQYVRFSAYRFPYATQGSSPGASAAIGDPSSLLTKTWHTSAADNGDLGDKRLISPPQENEFMDVVMNVALQQPLLLSINYQTSRLWNCPHRRPLLFQAILFILQTSS